MLENSMQEKILRFQQLGVFRFYRGEGIHHFPIFLPQLLDRQKYSCDSEKTIAIKCPKKNTFLGFL